MFNDYIRPLALHGIKNETVFWDLCVECPLYKTRQCSGGYRTLNCSPAYDRQNIQNALGGMTNHYYNKEFCKMYYGTNTLSQALTKPGVLQAHLLPHFFTLIGSTPYWFLVRPNAETQQLEFLPYRLFNTYSSGEICYGGNATNSYSLPQKYETFLNARVNSDLMPVSNVPIADWIRGFNPSKLTANREVNWGNSRSYLKGEYFDLVPPVFSKVTFLLISRDDIPENFRVLTASNQILPFLRNSQTNEWVCSKDINFPITAESAPAIYRHLHTGNN
jgi:hypothetical protein